MTTHKYLLPQSAWLRGFSSNIQSVVQRALDEQRLVGAVVLVSQHGEVIHQQASGFADREAVRPMTVDTVFRLASVSKPIVSVAALVLVAQGRLELDEDIGIWELDFQPRLADGRTARITARQLLSHMAGLSYRFFEADENSPYAMAGVSDGMDASGISLEENLRRIFADMDLVVYVAIGLWGLAFGGSATLFQTALAKAAGSTVDVAQSILVTVWNIAIAGGGLIGGVLLEQFGVSAFSPALLALLISSMIVVWTAKMHGFPLSKG
jgi:hypothetical protein